MKRIDFESKWVEEYNMGLLKFTGMEGIERGCGLVWEVDKWKIRSMRNPSFCLGLQVVFLPGIDLQYDNNIICINDKNSFDKVVGVLNAFNKAHAEPAIPAVPTEWSGHKVLQIEVKHGKWFIPALHIDIHAVPSYQRFQGYMYRSSDGQYRHRWSIVNIPGAELVGVLWAKE